MMNRRELLLAAVLGLAVAAPVAASPIETVTLPNASSPLVAIQIRFDAGSIHDPAGKEGLAGLTAMMIGQAGTQKRSYTDLIEALYPMAAGIEAETDREVTVIGGLVHRDRLADYTALLEEALLHPGFSKEDFERNRDQLSSTITSPSDNSTVADGTKVTVTGTASDAGGGVVAGVEVSGDGGRG